MSHVDRQSQRGTGEYNGAGGVPLLVRCVPVDRDLHHDLDAAVTARQQLIMIVCVIIFKST